MADCKQCGTELPDSLYARIRKAKGLNTAVRCVRCGMPHSDGEAIQPPMMPCDRPGRESPWQLPCYRPFLVGPYACRFRSTEPNVLVLQWNGQRFTHEGRNVSMLDFMGWRGTWE